MRIPIEDVLIKTCDIKGFSDIEGWDSNLMRAMVHYVHELRSSNINKATTRILSAWDAIEQKEKVVLEEHLGRKNIVIVGLAICVFEGMQAEKMNNMFKKIFGIQDEDDSDKGMDKE